MIDDPRVAAAALDGLRDGVLVVSSGEVLVANRAAHRLTGRSAGDLAGDPTPEWVAVAAARGGAAGAPPSRRGVHDAGKPLLSADLLTRPGPLSTFEAATCVSTPPSAPRPERARSTRYRARAMAEVTHREIDVNGLRMHVAERGEGPLVVLLHGFPESWYSWRHQLDALAEAGFHAVAPDQRGYGGTTAPDAIDRYTLLELVGDVVGLIDALGAGKAIVVGHDWGAPVAWHTALLRPDKVAGVAGLSVPFTPRMPASPMAGWREAFGDRFYQVYFQEPGVAEAELEADVRETMRRLLIGASGDRPAPDTDTERLPAGVLPPGGGFLDVLRATDDLPAWLTEEDLDFYAGEFTRTGFRGGLNWYRNQDRNWELLAPWQGAVVTPPALYLAGTRDPVVDFPGMDRLLPNLRMFVPNLLDSVLIDGVGHWTQQERADEVSERLVAFCRDVPR